MLKGLVPNKCAKYELGNIKNVDYMDDSSKISMSFTTKPNDALFEANLKIEEKDGSE